MTWTSTKPTVEGWYWWRMDENSLAIIVTVEHKVGDSWVRSLGSTQKLMLIFGQWSSTPIPQPEDK